MQFLPRYLCWIFVAVTLFVSTVGSAFAEQTSGQDLAQQVLTVSSEIREIGYSVGDVARQTIIVETPPGYRFDPASLPSIGKTSGVIELRDAQWQFEDMKTMTRHTLVLDWQIFQVLQEVRAYPLMPLRLLFRLDDSTIHAEPSPARVIVSSLLPARMDAGRLQHMPDVEPQSRMTTGMKMGLVAALLVLLGTVIYLGWYFDWLQLGQRWSRPYRVACREIRTIRKSKREGQEQLHAAMKSLRHAGDTSAGMALSRERLYLLFERNPWMLPLRKELEQLYADSDRLFFAGEAETADFERLYQLGCKLRALES